MKNKGFTLVEIIAVIVIMGILLLIVVPATSNFMRSNEEKEYATYYDIVEAGLEKYGRTRRNDIGGSTGSGCFDDKSLKDLIKLGYVKEFDQEDGVVCGTPNEFDEALLTSWEIDTSKTYSNLRVEGNSGKVSVKVSLICVRMNEDGTYSNEVEYVNLVDAEECKVITCDVNTCQNTVTGTMLGDLCVKTGDTCYSAIDDAYKVYLRGEEGGAEQAGYDAWVQYINNNDISSNNLNSRISCETFAGSTDNPAYRPACCDTVCTNNDGELFSNDAASLAAVAVFSYENYYINSVIDKYGCSNDESVLCEVLGSEDSRCSQCNAYKLETDTYKQWFIRSTYKYCLGREETDIDENEVNYWISVYDAGKDIHWMGEVPSSKKPIDPNDPSSDVQIYVHQGMIDVINGICSSNEFSTEQYYETRYSNDPNSMYMYDGRKFKKRSF